MKKYIFVLAGLAILTSCKKSANTPSPGLFGKWELRHRMGSILGFDSTFKAGNGQVLQFRSDSSYLQYNKGRLLTQGKFHIGTIDYPQNNTPAIFFDNSNYSSVLILNGDKLQIGADYDDGVEADYQKISD
jgi:hypothetical protein